MGHSLSKIPGNLGNYGVEMSDAFLALTKVMCDLRSRLDKQLSVNFDDDEAREYYKLEEKKANLISKIETWAHKQRAKYQVARRLILECEDHDTKVSIAKKFFSDPDVDKTIETLIREINCHKEEWKLFGDRLQKKYGGRSNAKLATAVFAIAGCLAVAVLVFAHLCPGINWAIATADYALVACTAAGFVSLATVTLSRDEFQRAIKYLENIETRLQDLRAAIQRLGGEHEEGKLCADYPDHCVLILDTLSGHCDRLIDLAQKA